jgi:hypothetical protein
MKLIIGDSDHPTPLHSPIQYKYNYKYNYNYK